MTAQRRCAGPVPRPGTDMASRPATARQALDNYPPQAPMVAKMSDLLPPAPTPNSPLARRTAVVSCWLCGIRLHQNQMVPDGGSACLDIRWYCKDIEACTGRWSSAQHRSRAAGTAAPDKAAGPPSGHTSKASADNRPRQPDSRFAPAGESVAPAGQSADREAGPEDGHQAGAADDRRPAGSLQSSPG